MDQANSLRNRMRSKVEEELQNSSSRSSRVITVTSGKGGVGKTNIVVNLAINFRKLGKRVVIIDADFGLANIEVLFGVLPQYSLAHVFTGERKINEIITEGPLGIQFISAGSGLKELANISERQMAYVIENFDYLDTISDIILIDTGAGISKSVINFIKASDETIIITTPEPTSVTDAYAIIKTIKSEETRLPEIKVIVNRVDDEKEGSDIFTKLSKVSENFLQIKLHLLGVVPYDHDLVKAVKKQEPVSLAFPNAEVTKSLEIITRKLLHIEDKENYRNTGMKHFMKKLINIFSS